MGFAAGKHAKFISDRSGAAFPYKEMRIEWNGSRVHTSEYEEKQPQLTPAKHISDAEALRYASTARVEPAVEVLLQRNAFRSGASGSSTITVTEPGHGRTTGDTGYAITKIDDDRYSFAASSGTATVGSTQGGGVVASAGPVTVDA